MRYSSPGGTVTPAVAQAVGSDCDDLRDQRGLAASFERLLAGHGLEQDGAERKDVAARIGLAALELFRRHVLHRPGDCPFLRERLLGRAVALHNRQRGSRLGDAEIQQLGTASGEDHIRRLDISVDNAGGMRGGQRASHLDPVAKGLLQGQFSARQPARQGLALQILHHQEIGAVVLPDVEEPADVRMTETGDEPRFAGQALLCVCVARMGVRQHLDGDRPLEA